MRMTINQSTGYGGDKVRSITSETVMYRCTHGPDQGSDGLMGVEKSEYESGQLPQPGGKVRVNNTCSYRGVCVFTPVQPYREYVAISISIRDFV